MIINYCNAPCGAGKTHDGLIRMLSVKGRYLLVRDRKEVITEFHASMFRTMSERNQFVEVKAVTSEGNQSVRRTVEELPEKYDDDSHVIVLITHRALLMSDFSSFIGWHIVIDETPSILDQQTLVSKRSRQFFERHYKLDHGHPIWSGITLTRDGWDTTLADLEEDDCNRLLTVLHDRVTDASPMPTDADLPVRIQRRAARSSGRAVLTNLRQWSDMEDGRRWTWWSLWTPDRLEAFESVEFLANGFDQSITYKLLKSMCPTIEWVERKLPSSRQFQTRNVLVEYYSEKQDASKTLFESETGKSYLNLIAKHLAGEVGQIWMANDDHGDELKGMGGERLRPKKAGSNAYAGRDAATAIYAAKPSPEARTVLKLLGVDSSVWTETHEHETVLQFVCRTSIRDPESTRPVTIRVFDRATAEYLARYFENQPHCVTTMELVDLGFANAKPNAGGRPTAPKKSVAEMDAALIEKRARGAATAKERRAKAKAEKVAMGEDRKPGRPKAVK